MQNWTDLYLELSELVAEKVPAIRWVDLWHNQISFLSDEHPFPAPAVFFGFRILETEDIGENVQDVKLQIDCYVYHETMADTYRGAWNQESALSFLGLINDTYAALHGTTGENYSKMRRIGFGAVDTGGAGNLYQQSFICYLRDYSAAKVYVEGKVNDIAVVKDNCSEPLEDSEQLYRI
ncbi:hypothetical protein [Chitinophaga sp. SYP-B3965]|uniref:hypothetical protein n=1 Tax=Chitinophaga sp. SYP-B3965 TaxID=2663120 RepID=UPI001C12AC88|nr:hypothetical protein [Chitinophaga sp. SYP-B3965]